MSLAPQSPPSSLAPSTSGPALKRTLSATSSRLSSAPPSPPPPAPVSDAPASATADLDGPPPVKRAKREPKPKPEVVLPARNTTSKIKIGAHISAAGGVQNACENAAKIGARCFALFLKSQRKWESPPLPTETIEVAFPDALSTHGYDPRADILPHLSYLVNHANPDAAKREKSYQCFLDDVKRCEALNIAMCNFHPGSAMKEDRPTALGWVADAINRAHAETKGVTIVLENMAGQGDVLGSRAEDLRDIIALVKDQSRVGVCVDTCHLHSSAVTNSLSPPSALHATLSTFFSIVPPRFLRALHVNDSKFEVGLKKDRHENLGCGHIGLEGFWGLLRWTGPDEMVAKGERWSWENIIWVLETPNDGEDEVWRREIEILYELEVLDDPSLIPAIQERWQKECAALKAAVAAKTKAKARGSPKKKAVKTEDADDDDAGEDGAHVHEEVDDTKSKGKAKATAKAKTPKKKAKKEIKEEDDYAG